MKKSIKIIVIILTGILFLELFGYKLVTVYFDNFQKEICINNTCIKKVKNWFPTYVKKDNKIYVFNLLNEDYIPFKSFKPVFKDYNNSVFFGNKDGKIVIVEIDKKNKLFNKNVLGKYTYKNKIYYVDKLSLTYKVFYPEKNLYITFLKGEDEMNFLKSFLEIN